MALWNRPESVILVRCATNGTVEIRTRACSLGQHVPVNADSPGRLSHEGDVVLVASEEADVPPDPLKGHSLVQYAEIAWNNAHCVLI